MTESFNSCLFISDFHISLTKREKTLTYHHLECLKDFDRRNPLNQAQRQTPFKILSYTVPLSLLYSNSTAGKIKIQTQILILCSVDFGEKCFKISSITRKLSTKTKLDFSSKSFYARCTLDFMLFFIPYVP